MDSKTGKVGRAQFHSATVVTAFDLAAVSAGPFTKAAATVSAVAASQKAGKKGR